MEDKCAGAKVDDSGCSMPVPFEMKAENDDSNVESTGVVVASTSRRSSMPTPFGVKVENNDNETVALQENMVSSSLTSVELPKNSSRPSGEDAFDPELKKFLLLDSVDDQNLNPPMVKIPDTTAVQLNINFLFEGTLGCSTPGDEGVRVDVRTKNARAKNEVGSRKRKITLNKAPREEVNGKTDTKNVKVHLARLSNLTVLDLRKRDSRRNAFIPCDLTTQQKSQLGEETNRQINRHSITKVVQQESRQMQASTSIVPPPIEFTGGEATRVVGNWPRGENATALISPPSLHRNKKIKLSLNQNKTYISKAKISEAASIVVKDQNTNSANHHEAGGAFEKSSKKPSSTSDPKEVDAVSEAAPSSVVLKAKSIEGPHSDNYKTTNTIAQSDWLQRLCDVEPNTPMDKSSAPSNNPHCHNFDELEFMTFSSGEYAFYRTEKPTNAGFLRLVQYAEQPRKRCRNFTLTFLVLVGEVRATIDDRSAIRKGGDVFIVNSGETFSIKNLKDSAAVLQFFKIPCSAN